MAELPKLTPYVVEGILSSDSFYTHYKAIATHLDDEYSYVITEFNPSFMVRRTEEGVLEPLERFIMEFETALERFTKMAEALENLGEPFVAPIEEILNLNNTVYVVRLMGGRYRNLDDGIGTEPMDFNNAYVLVRPLVQCFVSAYKKGLLFEFPSGSIVANSYGQLMVDAMFSWEESHQLTIVELMKIFYRLIAGVEYKSGNSSNPTIESIGLPPRLTALLKEVLTGDPSYGSIDDFGKRLRTIMDAEGKKEIITDKTPVIANTAASRPIKQKIITRRAALGVLAAVAVAAILLISGLLVWLRVNTGGYAQDYTDTDDMTAPTVPAVFVRLHTAYAVVDPRDPTVMLNGSFHERDGIVYQSAYQNGFGLARRIGGNIDMMVSGVRPAFIASHGDFIYFSDGFADYNIRRVRLDGSGLETISDHTASFLTVHGNHLFYTNHSHRDFLYRMDLNTLESTPFLRIAAYETAVHGGLLYFVNGHSGFRIYMVPVNEPDGHLIRVNQANSDNLRVVGGYVFYRDVEDNKIDRINPIHPGLVPSSMDIPFAAAGFDISGSAMVIIEEGTGELWFYNLATQSMVRTGSFASYAAVLGDVPTAYAYIIDYADSRMTGMVSFVPPPPLDIEADESEEIEEE